MCLSSVAVKDFAGSGGACEGAKQQLIDEEDTRVVGSGLFRVCPPATIVPSLRAMAAASSLESASV